MLLGLLGSCFVLVLVPPQIFDQCPSPRGFVRPQMCGTNEETAPPNRPNPSYFQKVPASGPRPGSLELPLPRQPSRVRPSSRTSRSASLLSAHGFLA